MEKYCSAANGRARLRAAQLTDFHQYASSLWHHIAKSIIL